MVKWEREGGDRKMPIKVKKKDGRLEGFDRTKISGGVIKSGVSSEEAEKITAQIETWVQSAAVDGIIKSSDIRIKALELLRLVNPKAATTFEAYRKV